MEGAVGKRGSVGSPGDPRPPVVLTNEPGGSRNPFLALWWDAVGRHGIVVRKLTLPSALFLGSPQPRWVQIQWPELVVCRPAVTAALRDVAKFALRIALARARGARVVCTVHNVQSHDARHPRLEQLVWRLLSLWATDVHLLSGAGAEEVFARHPRLRGKTCHVIPHGHYRPVVSPTSSRAAARASLGLPEDAKVMVHYGQLRRYKGAEELVRTFQALSDPSAVLVLAGEPREEGFDRDLAAAAARDARVRLVLERVDDPGLEQLITAADAVVLPYTRVLNSGSALLALSLDRPVLLPRTPTFDELASRVGDGWVFTYEGDIRPADLERILRREDPPDRPDLDWCDWGPISEAVGRMFLGDGAAGVPWAASAGSGCRP